MLLTGEHIQEHKILPERDTFTHKNETKSIKQSMAHRISLRENNENRKRNLHVRAPHGHPDKTRQTYPLSTHLRKNTVSKPLK